MTQEEQALKAVLSTEQIASIKSLMSPEGKDTCLNFKALIGYFVDRGSHDLKQWCTTQKPVTLLNFKIIVYSKQLPFWGKKNRGAHEGLGAYTGRACFEF